MSLIQEALKRQQEEQNGTAAAAPSIVPEDPKPSAPASPLQMKPASERVPVSEDVPTVNAPPRGGLAASLAEKAAATAPGIAPPSPTPVASPPPQLPPIERAASPAPVDISDSASAPLSMAKAPATATEPDTPTEASQLRHAEAATSESKPRIISRLLTMLFILALLAGGAVWMIGWGLGKFESKSVSEEANTTGVSTSAGLDDPDLPADAPAPVPVSPDGPAEPAPTVATDTPPSAIAPIVPSPVDVPDPTVAAAPVAAPVPVTPPVVVAPTTPAPVAVAVKPPPAPRPAPAAVAAAPKQEWPMLTLSAIVGRGVNGSALISGSILEAGESIKSVTLVSIKSGGVWLSYQGELRFLQQGMTTDSD
jgi:hypothetical protein